MLPWLSIRLQVERGLVCILVDAQDLPKEYTHPSAVPKLQIVVNDDQDHAHTLDDEGHWIPWISRS